MGIFGQLFGKQNIFQISHQIEADKNGEAKESSDEQINEASESNDEIKNENNLGNVAAVTEAEMTNVVAHIPASPLAPLFNFNCVQSPQSLMIRNRPGGRGVEGGI